MQERAERGECAPPPPPHTHTHTHALFWNLLVFLTKYVGKISRPNVVGKFRVFCDKKRNLEFYQYPVSQISNC